jgi:hypothetical protein
VALQVARVIHQERVHRASAAQVDQVGPAGQQELRVIPARMGLLLQRVLVALAEPAALAALVVQVAVVVAGPL